jgi:hypothetical protein
MPRGRPFVKGQSGNVKGRPKGIIDKRHRLNKALMADGDALLSVTKAKALEGDMTAMALLLPRMMPTLKPEGSPVRFALDASLETSKQIQQIIQALADGQLTVEEAKHIAEMIRLLAEARVADGAGEHAEKLVQAFREMAQVVDKAAPYTPPGTLTPAPPSVPGKCPLPWEK